MWHSEPKPTKSGLPIVTAASAGILVPRDDDDDDELKHHSSYRERRKLQFHRVLSHKNLKIIATVFNFLSNNVQRQGGLLHHSRYVRELRTKLPSVGVRILVLVFFEQEYTGDTTSVSTPLTMHCTDCNQHRVRAFRQMMNCFSMAEFMVRRKIFESYFFHWEWFPRMHSTAFCELEDSRMNVYWWKNVSK